VEYSVSGMRGGGRTAQKFCISTKERPTGPSVALHDVIPTRPRRGPTVERKLTLHSLAEREKGFDKTRAGGSEIDHNRRFELVWIWGTDAVGHRRRHKGSWVTGAGGGTRDSRSPHHTVTQQGRGVERFPSAVRALLALSDFGRSMEHLHGNGVVGGRLRVSQNTNIRRVGRQAREVRAPTQSLGSVGRSKAVGNGQVVGRP